MDDSLKGHEGEDGSGVKPCITFPDMTFLFLNVLRTFV
jgi:hypothetical protein